MKGEYGTVAMRVAMQLFDPQARALFGMKTVRASEPPTFEALKLSHWLVLYEADLPVSESSKDNVTLYAVPKDRALIYLDDRFSGTLLRTHNVNSIRLTTSGAKKLKILVENQGHVNFGNIDVEDFKVHFTI